MKDFNSRLWLLAVVVLIGSVAGIAQASQGVGISPVAPGSSYTAGKYGVSPPTAPSSINFLTSSSSSVGCDWSPIYGDTSTQNNAYPEANATYWQAVLPAAMAQGTSIEIDGQTPEARYSSISLYNSSYQLIATLSDYQMQTTSATAEYAYTSKTQKNPAATYGTPYHADVVVGAQPASPAPNTLYIPPQTGQLALGLPSMQKYYLMYRVYVPGGTTASGEEPLPTLTINGVPFSKDIGSAYCQNALSQLEQSLLFSIPIAPGQQPLSAPTNPTFKLYQASKLPVGTVGLNGDNAYMYAQQVTLPAGYVYLVRAKAATYTGEPVSSVATVTPPPVPQVRYWSICQNTSISTQVIGCVGDFQAKLDAAGYYTVVVTNDAAAPVLPLTGYNWLPFGPQSPTTVIYRQLVADDNFSGAAGSATMGLYTPEMTYCTTATFNALLKSNPNPAVVFAGCGGKSQ